MYVRGPGRAIDGALRKTQVGGRVNVVDGDGGKLEAAPPRIADDGGIGARGQVRIRLLGAEIHPVDAEGIPAAGAPRIGPLEFDDPAVYPPGTIAKAVLDLYGIAHNGAHIGHRNARGNGIDTAEGRLLVLHLDLVVSARGHGQDGVRRPWVARAGPELEVVPLGIHDLDRDARPLAAVAVGTGSRYHRGGQFLHAGCGGNGTAVGIGDEELIGSCIGDVIGGLAGVGTAGIAPVAHGKRVRGCAT